MNYLSLAFLIVSAGCSSCSGADIREAFDPQGPTAVIAVDMAQAVLQESKPAVNVAISELPDDVQLLAQMAYGALQVFVNKLDEMQPKSLALADPNTVNSTAELKDYTEKVKAQFDNLIH